MNYPTKYRERTIEYRKAGHTLEETHRTFKAAIATRRKWEKQPKEEGNLEKKPLHHSYKEEFGCSATAIYLAMKRLKITRKKRQQGIGSRTGKNSGVSGGDPYLSHGKDRICG